MKGYFFDMTFDDVQTVVWIVKGSTLYARKIH